MKILYLMPSFCVFFLNYSLSLYVLVGSGNLPVKAKKSGNVKIMNPFSLWTVCVFLKFAYITDKL